MASLLHDAVQIYSGRSAYAGPRAEEFFKSIPRLQVNVESDAAPGRIQHCREIRSIFCAEPIALPLSVSAPVPVVIAVRSMDAAQLIGMKRAC